LRKTYSSRLKKALIATGLGLALILVGTVLANKIGKKSAEDIDVLDTQMAEIKKDEALPPPPPPPPPPPTPPPPPEINQVKFTPPTVVPDEEVVEKVEDIKEDAAISTKTVETENKVQIVQAPVDEPKVIDVPTDDEGKVFNKVEIEAEYPGGAAAWGKYLRNNLDANTPVDNGASEGTYTVVVRFIVSRDGSISDVVAETKHGFGMEAEAIKIIKKGPKWTPAQQNGRYVNAYRRQPITFVVQEN
jgi:protein TonB